MKITEPELPAEMTFETLQAYKAALREYDRKRIAAGEVTPAQVQSENSIIPWPSVAKVLRFPEAEFEEEYGPGNYIPPVFLTFWSFRLMVGTGVVMLALVLYALYLVMQRKLNGNTRFLRILSLAFILPYIANSTGWLLTELGRQPWIVYGLQKTEDAVSPNVPASTVLFSLIGFAVVYGALIVVDVYLLVKFARQPDAAH